MAFKPLNTARLLLVYRMEHPWCARCWRNGEKIEATAAQYIVPVENGGQPRDPSNMISLCDSCRAGNTESTSSLGKKVYLVAGPPLAGKTTYVANNRQSGDLIIDLDSLFHALSGEETHNKPPQLLKTIWAVRDFLWNHVQNRNGNWNTAWVIATMPTKFERDQSLNALRADLVLLKPGMDECISRLNNSTRPNKEHQEILIREWFENFTE